MPNLAWRSAAPSQANPLPSATRAGSPWLALEAGGAASVKVPPSPAPCLKNRILKYWTAGRKHWYEAVERMTGWIKNTILRVTAILKWEWKKMTSLDVGSLEWDGEADPRQKAQCTVVIWNHHKMSRSFKPDFILKLLLLRLDEGWMFPHIKSLASASHG